MAKEKINLEEITKLTKELFHAHYAGNLEHWFSYLCPESVYLGTGEPLLFGGDAIRKHFEVFMGRQADIIQEEYFPIALSDCAAQVCGKIIVTNQDDCIRAISHFTIGYRIIGGEIKMVHQHNSYEYMQYEKGISSVIILDMNSMQFVRNLLLKQPPRKRIPIQSGKQTIYVNPYTILYVQSQRKNTEIVCIDRVISCNSPIGKLAKELPQEFYPLHRGYLVNTLYIVAIRRFEAELLSGLSLPIPALTYTQVKRDLQEMMQTRICTS